MSSFLKHKLQLIPSQLVWRTSWVISAEMILSAPYSLALSLSHFYSLSISSPILSSYEVHRVHHQFTALAQRSESGCCLSFRPVSSYMGGTVNNAHQLVPQRASLYICLYTVSKSFTAYRGQRIILLALHTLEAPDIEASSGYENLLESVVVWNSKKTCFWRQTLFYLSFR